MKTNSGISKNIDRLKNDPLLTREDFKRLVFAKTNGICAVKGCMEPAVDCHHILDRKLWSDGGYYISNGIPLCGKHHLDAEQGVITPMQCFELIDIDVSALRKPDKIDLEYKEYIELLISNKLNKWGE